MRDPALTQAFELLGGQTKTADLLGITVAAVNQWKRCPHTRVIDIERLTGGKVPRQKLRPDLYPPRHSRSVA